MLAICADLIDNIPGRDDTWVQKAVKLASIVEVIRSHTEEEGNGVDKFARERGLESFDNAEFVNLFWATPLKKSFKAHEFPIDEGTRIRRMTHPELGSLYFVEYTDGGPLHRAEHFYHDPGFDFEAALGSLWAEYGGRINVKFIESSLGTAAAYGAMSAPDDPFVGSAKARLDRMVEKHAQYKADGVARTYLAIGDPGLGKSAMALHAARAIGDRTLRIDSQSLNGFGTAEMRFLLGALKPDTMIIDDIDKANMYSGIATLLTVFEWIKYDHPNVAVILTTNSARLPAALKRPGRIDEPIWFKAPDENDRKAILEVYLERHGVEASKQAVDKLVGATAGLGAAWLKEIALQMRYERVDDVIDVIASMRRLRRRSRVDDDAEEEEALDPDGENDEDGATYRGNGARARARRAL